MSYNLPSLYALKVFESAARYNSFAKASEQLHITRGAVSKQIKLLEDYLGLPLFSRSGKHLLLTPRGHDYAIHVRETLAALEVATEQCQEGIVDEETLHISILPSNSRWIIPAVKGFQERYPHIKVAIKIGGREVDFEKVNTDIAFRTAERNLWPNYHSTVFMHDKIIAVCSPTIKHIDINNAEDLMQLPLIGHTMRPNMWNEFMEAAGYSGVSMRSVLNLEHFFMVIEAAENGFGIALLPEFLIRKELTAGTLIPALPFRFNSVYEYYMVIPGQKTSLKKIKAFSAWIKEYAELLQ